MVWKFLFAGGETTPGKMIGVLFIYVFFVSCALPTANSLSVSDTLSVNQTLRDGETIVSENGDFVLGFFTPSNGSANRYLGIWFSFSPGRVVWVANRKSPFNDTSGTLRVTLDGALELSSSEKGNSDWRTVVNGTAAGGNPVAQLLDTGNLVVRDSSTNYLWQSFENLTDTALSKAQIGTDLLTGVKYFLQSWKSSEDPSLGDALFMLDAVGWPQHFLTVSGSIIFRSGPWNGLTFPGMTNLRSTVFQSFGCSASDSGFYCIFGENNQSEVSILMLTNDGALQRFNYSENSRSWDLYTTLHTDACDSYALCGDSGVCDLNSSPQCTCWSGFTPKSPADWAARNWSSGCVREEEVVCGRRIDFQAEDGVKLPDARNSWSVSGVNMTECRRLCAGNCSCYAYSMLDTSTGTGCLFWPMELLDMRKYATDTTIFVKTSASGTGSHKTRKLAIALAVSVSAATIILISLLLTCNSRRLGDRNLHNVDIEGEDGRQDSEFAIYDLATIEKATNGFSVDMKLGNGGFGTVYMGTLEDGQEIAVKRLSKESGQGMTEFKNEVSLIAKLQHRNLVRLLGCCIHGDEKMLVYEFMPNKSLDYFIFDSERRKVLDWGKLVDIIIGIARGLMYLHQDSRLRIIHRDLKGSNVLLDSTMTPKISDFGMARLMKEDEQGSQTKVVVGTYGYISPEYAIDGVFSIKSDVFSFGVVVLEIISGKKNRGFRHPDHEHNLVGHAWKLWVEGRPMELVEEDERDTASFPQFWVLRCLHVGLLCVQQRPDDRPSMSSALQMLNSETALPQPKQPGFFAERSMPDTGFSNSDTHTNTNNELTVTLFAR